MALFFGEPEKQLDKIKPDQMFGDLWKFARDVEITRKDKIEKEEREKKRKAAADKQLAKAAGKGSPRPASTAREQPGLYI